jgi:outer membrane protein TolC
MDALSWRLDRGSVRVRTAAHPYASHGDLLPKRNLMATGLEMASEPVLDAGRDRASVRKAKEQYGHALLAYRGSVIGCHIPPV